MAISVPKKVSQVLFFIAGQIYQPANDMAD